MEISLGEKLGTELGCSLGGKITIASIPDSSIKTVAYSSDPTAASFLPAAAAVSKFAKGGAVMVHSTS